MAIKGRSGRWRSRILAVMLAAISSAAAAQGSNRTLAVAVGDLGTTLDTRTFQSQALPILNSTQEALFEYAYKETNDPRVQIFDNTQIRPALAESFEHVPGKSITIRLRPAKSAAGNTLTSADLLWTIQRNVALNTLGVYAMRQMGVDMSNPVTVIDERTVRFNLAEQRTPAEHFLTWWILAPLDSTELKRRATPEDPWATNWLATNSAGFGPYRVANYRSAESATLERNPNYWGPQPDIARIVIRAVPDAGNRQQLLQAGQVQYVPDLPRQLLRELQARPNSGVAVSYVPFTRISYLNFNVTSPPFDNPLVRRAVGYALPYQALVQQVYGADSAQPASGPVPTLLGYQTPEPWPYRQDAGRARQLLAEAGFRDGIDMQMHYCLCNPGPEMQQVAVLIQNALAEAGIRVALRQEPSNAVFQAGLFGRRFPVALASATPFASDAGFALANMVSTGGAQNNGGYNSPEMDRLIAALNTTPDGPARAAIVTQVRRLWEQDMPFALLLQPHLAVAFANSVTGYRSHASSHAFFKYFRFTN